MGTARWSRDKRWRPLYALIAHDFSSGNVSYRPPIGKHDWGAGRPGLPRTVAEVLPEDRRTVVKELQDTLDISLRWPAACVRDPGCDLTCGMRFIGLASLAGTKSHGFRLFGVA